MFLLFNDPNQNKINKQINKSTFSFNKQVLYLRWNKHHLIVFYKVLMTQL